MEFLSWGKGTPYKKTNETWGSSPIETTTGLKIIVVVGTVAPRFSTCNLIYNYEGDNMIIQSLSPSRWSLDVLENRTWTLSCDLVD